MSQNFDKNKIAQYLKFSKWGIGLSGLFSLSYLGDKNFLVGVALLAICGFLLFDRFKKLNNWKSNASEILAEIAQDKANKKSLQQETASQKKQTKDILVTYELGLPEYSLNGSYNISSAQNGLTFKKTFGKESIVIPWNELLEVEAGSEADLRRRITVTRVLLTGIFALALKKERKKGFYISVVKENDLGMFEVNTSGKNNRENEKLARNFAAACNARIKQSNPEGTNRAIAESASKYDEIEKLGALLEKGLITESEFKTQKAKLLD